MTREELKKFRDTKKLEQSLKKSIAKLYKQLENVPVVAGKVKSSSQSHPYTPVSLSVDMKEPKEVQEIRARIKMKEEMLEEIKKSHQMVEDYLLTINDLIVRSVIQMIYVDGLTMQQVADELGYHIRSIRRIVQIHFKNHKEAPA